MRQIIRNGRPDVKQNCSPGVAEYWNYRAELSEVDDIIYKGSKIVIPKRGRCSKGFMKDIWELKSAGKEHEK